MRSLRAARNEGSIARQVEVIVKNLRLGVGIRLIFNVLACGNRVRGVLSV